MRNRKYGTPTSEELALLIPGTNTSPKQQILLKRWEELPLWQQEDNHFIQTGYREASESLLKCFHSWSYLHNESVNIYSHLFGALLFIVLPTYIYGSEIPPRYKIATTVDLVVCVIYFGGVAICFLLSAIFHTIMNHSSMVNQLGAQLDFQGVLLLMWGATVPLIYYGFYCEEELQLIYWSLLTIFALACSIFTFQPHFNQPFFRPLRAATFASLALATLIPIIHGVVKYGWEVQSPKMGLNWVLVTLALNMTGAGAYAVKFPEIWFEKRFDIWGASHQWLHIMVVLAALTHTMGVLQAFDALHAHADKCRIS